jgi:uncharacterized protein involved in type VI secretion and phage assembly
MSLPEFLSEGGGGGVRGVAVGVVTDNEDDEGLGRVKLTFPWRADDYETDWVRVATPMAGDGTGTYFQPQPDDEVLVAFEDGDIHHPYVVGALWNGQEPPPRDNADGANTERTIRSREGHEIVFDDDESAGKLAVRTAGGNEIVLDDSGGGETISMTDAGGNAVTLDDGGAVSVEAATSLSLSAPSIELKADGKLTIQAGALLELEGVPIKLN